MKDKMCPKCREIAFAAVERAKPFKMPYSGRIDTSYEYREPNDVIDEYEANLKSELSGTTSPTQDTTEDENSGS